MATYLSVQKSRGKNEGGRALTSYCHATQQNNAAKLHVSSHFELIRKGKRNERVENVLLETHIMHTHSDEKAE